MVSCDPATETTVVEAYTVDMVLRNLITQEVMDVPKGNQGIIRRESTTVSPLPQRTPPKIDESPEEVPSEEPEETPEESPEEFLQESTEEAPQTVEKDSLPATSQRPVNEGTTISPVPQQGAPKLDENPEEVLQEETEETPGESVEGFLQENIEEAPQTIDEESLPATNQRPVGDAAPRTKIRSNSLLSSRNAIRQSTSSTVPSSIGSIGTGETAGTVVVQTENGDDSEESTGDTTSIESTGGGAETSTNPSPGVRPSRPDRQSKTIRVHIDN